MLIESLLKHAAQRPRDPALLLAPDADLDGGRDVMSWAALARLVECTAHRLAAFDGGDRRVCVAHVVENTWHDVILALSCPVAGFVEAPIDCSGGVAYEDVCRQGLEACDGFSLYWIDETEKRSIIEESLRSATTAPCELGGRVALAPHDDALILWTGGTTGESKGVVLSHASLHSNAAAKLRAVPQSVDDLRLTLLSISHGYARTSDLGTWLLSGCRLAIGRGFQGWEDYAGTRPTLINAVPSLAERLIDTHTDALRLLGCGGASMATDAFEAWRDRGVTVIQGYGLTETGPVICSQTPQSSIAERVGGFVDGWEHRIEGERLFVRGRHLMSRYLDDPEATADVLAADGWFDTGDLVRWDDQADQLEIVGRSGDRITLSNGHNVDPVRIETRYAALAAIRNAVVMCSEDTRRVELWIEWEGDQRVDVSPVTESFARWERPVSVNEFKLPETLRSRWANRKGMLRREPLISWLRESVS
ncbi:MAG: AMP-binding protein [Planctomycetota bacterium]